jgi:signal transduction histidine kinase
MSAAFVQPPVSRSVAWRLAAGVLPSVLAVALVVGLFYYGKAGRAVPRATLLIAVVLTATSIGIAWLNARYFAERLARIARGTKQASGVTAPSDELDRIEQAVGSLGSALTAAEAERARTDAKAAARLRDQGTMLAGAVTDSLAQLDQVRLPLQILLESPFGELNDNQEELLRDARAAADAIDGALRGLGRVADIDRNAVQVQRELVQVNDVVRSVLPLARATADRQGARTETALEPGLPRVVADRARLAEALSLLVSDASHASGPDRPLVIGTARDGSRAIVRISPITDAVRARASSLADAPASPAAPDSEAGPGAGPLILASRLIAVQGGTMSIDGDCLVLQIGGP